MAKKNKNYKNNLFDLEGLIGKEMSDVSCLMAAGILLEKAGTIAERNNDSETLMNLARAWFNLSQHIAKMIDEEDNEAKNPLGFIPPKKEDK